MARQGDAVSDGVVLQNCSATTIELMAVLTAGGAAFSEQDGCSGNTFLGCGVLRPLPVHMQGIPLAGHVSSRMCR